MKKMGAGGGHQLLSHRVLTLYSSGYTRVTAQERDTRARSPATGHWGAEASPPCTAGQSSVDLVLPQWLEGRGGQAREGPAAHPGECAGGTHAQLKGGHIPAGGTRPCA